MRRTARERIEKLKEEIARRKRRELERLEEAKAKVREKEKKAHIQKVCKRKKQHEKRMAKLQRLKEEKERKKEEKIAWKSARENIDSRWFEKFTFSDDLYQTREEIMAAEKRGEGKINWDTLDAMIQEFREKIN